MKVSALIPTYNRREYVQRAIESILAQTLPVDELIVVDDGSTDGTAEAIQSRFGNHVSVVRQPNQGVSIARQRAIKEASGEWIAFLDSDDVWTPDRNRLFMEAAAGFPRDVAWIFGDARLIRDEGECETIFEKFGLHLGQGPKIFEDSMSVQHPFQFGLLEASVVRRTALHEVEAFGAGLRCSEDFLVGVQIACRYRVAAIPNVVNRVFRTSDLASTSLDLAGRHSPDHYRARMIAYSLVAKSRRNGQWGEVHAEAVRGMCKILAEKGEGIRGLSLKQFSHGVSGKSVAFACAAMLGQPGIKLWMKLGETSRSVLRTEEGDAYSF